MNRIASLRIWLCVFALVGLMAAAALAPNLHAQEKRPPNFLVILCDDLGYGDLGCYGNQTIRTPNLDRLASEGLRLTDCYAAAPVCSPSRAGLLTGRTPNRAGIYDWIPGGSPVHLRQHETTLPGLLRQAGYATCHVGKWHLNGKFNSDAQPQPGDHGFDYWFSTQNNAAPSHENPRNFVRNGERAGPLSGYSADLVAAEADRWLRERPKEKPFFLFVCFHEPHEPIASDAQLVAQYPDAKKRGEALYYANVAQMDRALGRLMKTVDELQLRDDTLVFFTSDNGPETLNRYRGAWRSHGSPGPLRGMKLHIYEGGIRVPGILRWPGHTRAGQTSAEPVCSTDLLPTLCAVAGVDVPADRPLDGANFLPLLEGKPIDRSVPLYWHYYRAIGKPKVAIRQGDWKLLAHWNGGDLRAGAAVRRGDYEIISTAKLTDFELYNLREDLAETDDRAAAEPQRVKQMSAVLRKMYQQVQAEGPRWEFSQ